MNEDLEQRIEGLTRMRDEGELNDEQKILLRQLLGEPDGVALSREADHFRTQYRRENPSTIRFLEQAYEKGVEAAELLDDRMQRHKATTLSFAGDDAREVYFHKQDPSWGKRSYQAYAESCEISGWNAKKSKHTELFIGDVALSLARNKQVSSEQQAFYAHMSAQHYFSGIEHLEAQQKSSISARVNCAYALVRSYELSKDQKYIKEAREVIASIPLPRKERTKRRLNEITETLDTFDSNTTHN